MNYLRAKQRALHLEMPPALWPMTLGLTLFALWLNLKF